VDHHPLRRQKTRPPQLHPLLPAPSGLSGQRYERHRQSGRQNRFGTQYAL